MKITAFIGSGRKQHTYRAAELFLQKLQALGNVDYEIVRLSDYSIEPCKGCRQCLDKGSEFCPLKDDRDLLIEKINCSDGVVFATPNYAFQVSGMMKNFIDRMAFILHRPRYFGKTFTCIVAQGISQGEKITEYLDFIGRGLGFNIIKGCCIKTLEPITEAGRAKIEKTIDSHSRKFYQILTGSKNPVPTMFWLMAFRMARTSVPTPFHLAVWLSDELRGLQTEDPQASITIVTRSPEAAKGWVRLLRFGSNPRLALAGDFEFRPGLTVTAVTEVKGLEFDYVILPDAASTTYPDTPESRRALYVALTRATHQLVLAAAGTFSPMLELRRPRAEQGSLPFARGAAVTSPD